MACLLRVKERKRVLCMLITALVRHYVWIRCFWIKFVLVTVHALLKASRLHSWKFGFWYKTILEMRRRRMKYFVLLVYRKLSGWLAFAMCVFRANVVNWNILIYFWLIAAHDILFQGRIRIISWLGTSYGTWWLVVIRKSLSTSRYQVTQDASLMQDLQTSNVCTGIQV